MKWTELLDRVPKLVQVGVLFLGAVSVGWTGRAAFSLQVGIPDTVNRTVVRVDDLEHRMESAEAAISEIAQNTFRLRSLSAKIDTMVAQGVKRDELALDTYCVTYSHAKGLDLALECTLVPPAQKRRQINGGEQ